MSTQKLAIGENCVVSYGPNFYVIQELTSKTLTGGGDPGNGMYYLRFMRGGSVFTAMASTLGISDVW